VATALRAVSPSLPFYFIISRIPRQLRSHRRVKSAKQQEELFDYGKKMFRDGIGCVRIRVWNYCALKRWHGYD
jgi:hypothetical protein